MTALTAADYADTGQWRLIVKIFADGISAYLENTLHDDVEPQELFTSSWENNPDGLLQRIENAVYDHPRVLDDFSARIVVFDRRTLFMPTELLVETEDAEDEFYKEVYDADEEDIMCDTDGDITAAFSLAPGLKSFLNRTFPGARLGCNLMRSVADLRKEGEGLRLYLVIREKETDFILLDGRDLISASTHSCECGADIAYHGFNLMNVYGIDPKDVMVATEGEELPDDAKLVFSKFTKGCRQNDNTHEKQ